jgi:CRP-like cAMP-binding protein
LSVRADAESLRRIPIFRNCEAVPLQVLAFAAERESFGAGEMLFTDQQRAEAAYFLLQGDVTLRQHGEIVGQAEPGALLGELAMIGGSNYTLSAEAHSDVQTVRIDRALFHRVTQEYPEFGQAVVAALSEKLGLSLKELESVRQVLTKGRGKS